MLYFSWPCSCFWTGMKCNKVVELDGRELVSKKMKVVVSKVFAAAGMVKGCMTLMLLTISRGRGALGWHLGEVCAENKDCSRIFHCIGTLHSTI